MPENIGELIATINGKLDTLLAELQGADARLGDRLLEAERDRNRISDRIEEHVLDAKESFRAHDDRIRLVEDEVKAFRNRALGAIITASLLTGGSVFGAIQLFGG